MDVKQGSREYVDGPSQHLTGVCKVMGSSAEGDLMFSFGTHAFNKPNTVYSLHVNPYVKYTPHLKLQTSKMLGISLEDDCNKSHYQLIAFQ